MQSSRLSIMPPDFDYWHSYFPRGLGGCAFSSPHWQALEFTHFKLTESNAAGWRQVFLRIDGPRGPLTYPMLGRQHWSRRWLLQSRPIGYAVTPIERAMLSPEEVEAVVDAISTPKIAWCSICLPFFSPVPSRVPWVGSRGRLSYGSASNYVLTLESTVEAHLRQHVSKRNRCYFRANERAGLRIVHNPDARQVDEYYALYSNVHKSRSWTGSRFSRDFFARVRDMRDSARLDVVLHEDKVVAGGVILIDEHCVTFFTGCTDRSVKPLRPDLSYYLDVFRYAEQRGIRWLNMGGVNSGNSTLIQYKEAWGAQDRLLTNPVWSSGARTLFEWAAGRQKSADTVATAGVQGVVATLLLD